MNVRNFHLQIAEETQHITVRAWEVITHHQSDEEYKPVFHRVITRKPPGPLDTTNLEIESALFRAAEDIKTKLLLRKEATPC